MRDNKILFLILFVFPLHHSFSQIIDEFSVYGGVGRSNSYWSKGDGAPNTLSWWPSEEIDENRLGWKEGVWTTALFLTADKKLNNKLAVTLDLGLDQRGYREYIYENNQIYSPTNEELIVRITQLSYYLSFKISPFKQSSSPSFYLGLGASNHLRTKITVFDEGLDLSGYNTYYEQPHLDDLKPRFFSGLVGMRQEFNNSFYYRLELTNSLNNNYKKTSTVRGVDLGFRLSIGVILFKKNKLSENG